VHLPMYGAAETLDELARKFAYIFDDRIQALPGTTKPQGRAMPLTAGETVRIAGVDVTAVPVPHGPVTVFAYRIGPLAYVTDAKSIPESSMALLRGARVLVINALFREAHPSHLSLSEALGAAAAIGAERTYLTHLTHDNFHAALAAELPSGVAPAFDGLTITL
jgi:phosphoribosyl 1,2-cyclic phosphate phosphodiesterase